MVAQNSIQSSHSHNNYIEMGTIFNENKQNFSHGNLHNLGSMTHVSYVSLSQLFTFSICNLLQCGPPRIYQAFPLSRYTLIFRENKTQKSVNFMRHAIRLSIFSLVIELIENLVFVFCSKYKGISAIVVTWLAEKITPVHWSA